MLATNHTMLTATGLPVRACAGANCTRQASFSMALTTTRLPSGRAPFITLMPWTRLSRQYRPDQVHVLEQRDHLGL